MLRHTVLVTAALLWADLLASADLARAAPPPHDACSAATAVLTTPFVESVDTTEGTVETAEPLLSCGAGGGGTTVWYRFTPPADGMVCVRTCGSGYDTVLAAFSGTCDALAEFACNDDGCGAQASLQIGVTSGVPLLFTVAGFAGGEGGGLNFRIAYTTDDSEDSNAGGPDGVPDCGDNCPDVFNPDQLDSDGDGVGDDCEPCAMTGDADADGVCDPVDNCPEDLNLDQLDTDNDGFGDACDGCTGPGPDSDGDGICDAVDNCPFDDNFDQADGENNDVGDGVGDACDNCPDSSNANQLDSDLNGVGDACAVCPPFEDNDGDNVCDDADNCTFDFNPDQEDTDEDGVGNACEPTPTSTSTATPTPTGSQTSAQNPTATPTGTNTPGTPSTITPTLSPTAVATSTPTRQLIPSSSPTATPTRTGRPSSTPGQRPACVGDCDGSGNVLINELVIMVNIALEASPLSTCSTADVSGDQRVTINEIVQAVKNVLNDCA